MTLSVVPFAVAVTSWGAVVVDVAACAIGALGTATTTVNIGAIRVRVRNLRSLRSCDDQSIDFHRAATELRIGAVSRLSMATSPYGMAREWTPILLRGNPRGKGPYFTRGLEG